eukprot:GILI01033821.1.p1 GENE.GILI01033821.1~~GILI01033821.1.p1  ORF type:complete len:385 (-),score=44.98 GILI01033821.1:47-1117(-)
MILQYVLRRRRDPKRDGLPSALLGYPPSAVDGEDVEGKSVDSSSLGSSFDDCNGYLEHTAPNGTLDQRSQSTNSDDMMEETYYSGSRGRQGKAPAHDDGSFGSTVSILEMGAHQPAFAGPDLGATFAGPDSLNIWPQSKVAETRKGRADTIGTARDRAASHKSSDRRSRSNTNALPAEQAKPVASPSSPIADTEETKKTPFIEQCRDWWYYFRHAVPLPLLSVYPKEVILNWNDRFYKDPNASERVKKRRQRSYRAQYEGKPMFTWLFWRERGARERMSIHNPLMPTSEEPPINVQHINDHDPFVFGENIAGQPNEVCIGRAPYTVRLARPDDWRLCLYTGAEEGGEEEFELPSGE